MAGGEARGGRRGRKEEGRHGKRRPESYHPASNIRRHVVSNLTLLSPRAETHVQILPRIALRLSCPNLDLRRTHVARALAPLDLLAISQLPGDARVTLLLILATDSFSLQLYQRTFPPKLLLAVVFTFSIGFM